MIKEVVINIFLIFFLSIFFSTSGKDLRTKIAVKQDSFDYIILWISHLFKVPGFVSWLSIF